MECSEAVKSGRHVPSSTCWSSDRTGLASPARARYRSGVERVATRRTHRVHVGSHMACRWGQWSSAAKCIIIIIIINIDIIVPCSSGTLFYSSRHACCCSLRTGQGRILIGASRRRYRIQMMEAAVVGEEAELHVQAQMEGLASGLAARSDRSLPTLALTKAIHSFTSLPSPRSCSCSCSTCHSFPSPS